MYGILMIPAFRCLVFRWYCMPVKNVSLQGFNLDLTIFLPETNTSHDILYSLDLNAKIATRDGKWHWKRDDVTKKWRRTCLPADGWVDCWSAPKVTLAIEFLFHQVPMAGPPPQVNSNRTKSIQWGPINRTTEIQIHLNAGPLVFHFLEIFLF